MKFREFITSSGKKVLAGKDARSNEQLIKQVGKNEEVFHTALPGSPFVNIKSRTEGSRTPINKKAGTKQKVNKKDIKEAAVFCAAKSQDWRDNKGDVEVHRFKGKDVYKRKDMRLGTFGVKKFKLIKVKKKDIERFLK